MIIYGVGDHIADMLMWHPELAGRIERVFDKDPYKKGKKLAKTDKCIESPEGLRDLPSGTKIAIAAIRYLDEITSDILNINPELVCLNIDDAYYMDESELSGSDMQFANENVYKDVPTIVQEDESVESSVSGMQSLGDEDVYREEAMVAQDSETLESRLCKHDGLSLGHWQVQLLLQLLFRRHVFWGTKGARAVYLQREFLNVMERNDSFIDDDITRQTFAERLAQKLNQVVDKNSVI